MFKHLSKKLRRLYSDDETIIKRINDTKRIFKIDISQLPEIHSIYDS